MRSGAVSGGLALALADSYPNETFQWLVRYDAPGNTIYRKLSLTNRRRLAALALEEPRLHP